MRALLLAFLALPAAGAEPVSCPLTLPADALTVRAPTGWHGSSPMLLRLTGGAVIRGHPDGLGYLVPFKSTLSKQGSIQTFVFEPGEERWLWCSYGRGSPQLAKRLTNEGTECTVTRKESKSEGVTAITAKCH